MAENKNEVAQNADNKDPENHHKHPHHHHHHHHVHWDNPIEFLMTCVGN